MMIPLLHFLFSFLIYEVSYSKNIKNFRKNAEFIFAIGFQTVFWGTYFCETWFWGSDFCSFGPIHKSTHTHPPTHPPTHPHTHTHTNTHTQLYNFNEETPTQVLSSEYCEIFKSTFFIEHLRWLLLYWVLIVMAIVMC